MEEVGAFLCNSEGSGHSNSVLSPLAKNFALNH